MFLRGFQEGGKLDFVVKVKWQKYLEASVQSIRDLELEPATDQATVLCCLCLSRPSPQSLPVPAAPRQPPAHSRAQSGTGDLLPKPLLHMHVLPEESQRALGMFIFTSTLLLAYFWQRYTLHLLQQRIDEMQPSLLTLCCSQGSRTHFCFLSLFNS